MLRGLAPDFIPAGRTAVQTCVPKCWFAKAAVTRWRTQQKFTIIVLEASVSAKVLVGLDPPWGRGCCEGRSIFSLHPFPPSSLQPCWDQVHLHVCQGPAGQANQHPVSYDFNSANTGSNLV